MFRRAGELFTQLRILGRDTYRAGIKMTFAHHNATQCDKRRSSKAELFCPQQCGNGDIAPGLDLAVGL